MNVNIINVLEIFSLIFCVLCLIVFVIAKKWKKEELLLEKLSDEEIESINKKNTISRCSWWQN